MKKNELITGMAFTFGGFLFLFVGLMTKTVLNSILIGLGSGGIGSGISVICRYFYWNAPKNRKRYQEKVENEQIELHDELKIKLRDKSGRYTYTIGLIALSISMVVFSILDSLGIVNSRLLILFLGGYMVFQIAAGILIFQYLLKKY